MSADAPAPEFSRRVDLARIGSRETVHAIVAEPAERAALARRFDLVALDRLEAELHLKRLSSEIVRLEGRFTAELVQSCVVTLEPVPGRLEEEFSMLYGPLEPGETAVVDFESEIVEPLEGQAIDIGEAVAQQLAVAIDPYPRAPGAGEAGASVPDEPDG